MTSISGKSEINLSQNYQLYSTCQYKKYNMYGGCTILLNVTNQSPLNLNVTNQSPLNLNVTNQRPLNLNVTHLSSTSKSSLLLSRCSKSTPFCSNCVCSFSTSSSFFLRVVRRRCLCWFRVLISNTAGGRTMYASNRQTDTHGNMLYLLVVVTLLLSGC